MPNRFQINIENNQDVIVSFKNKNNLLHDLPQVKNELFNGISDLNKYFEIKNDYHKLKQVGMVDFSFDVADERSYNISGNCLVFKNRPNVCY